MQGGVLLVATTFVLVNLVVDLLYAVFDPRIRYERDRSRVPEERERPSRPGRPAAHLRLGQHARRAPRARHLP
ncbi:MAG: hypothetical protein AAB328_06085, partial [candidate division NC10 bacterium]